MPNEDLPSEGLNVEPIVRIYDPQDEVKKAIASLAGQQKIIHNAMVGVIVVVAVGFVTLIIATFDIFISHEDYAEQRYRDYIELLKEKEQEIMSFVPAQQNMYDRSNEAVNSKK